MRALVSLVWTEGKLFGRETATIVFAFTLPLIWLYLLASSLGNVPASGSEVFGEVGALDFYLPVYLVIIVTAVGFIVLPCHLVEYRRRGVLRRFRASTVPGWAVVASQILVSVGIAFAAALLLVGTASLFGKATPPGRPWPSLLAYLLVAVTFASVGLVVGSTVTTTRGVRAIGILSWSCSLLLAGAMVPVDALPGTMRTLGQASPVYAAVRLVQEPWWGHPWHWGAFAVTAGLLVVAALMTLRLFRWE